MSSILARYFIFSSLCLFVSKVGAYDALYEDDLSKLQATVDAVIAQGARKSLLSTPCWKIGGICIDRKICPGYKFLSQVPGCKDTNRVCCFTWNQYKIRDFVDAGISAPGLPWSHQIPFGGKGLIGSIESQEDGTKAPPTTDDGADSHHADSNELNKPNKPKDSQKLNKPNKPNKLKNSQETDEKDSKESYAPDLHDKLIGKLHDNEELPARSPKKNFFG